MAKETDPRMQDLVREHAQRRQAMKEENEELRKQVLASVGQVSSGLLDCVNKDVAKAFVNEKLIEAELQKLQSGLEVFFFFFLRLCFSIYKQRLLSLSSGHSNGWHW